MDLDANQLRTLAHRDSQAAVIQLIELFYERIYAFARRLAGNDEDAADLTQRTFHGADDDWVERAGRRLPMGRLGDVDEIADFVVFLLSDRSGVVTGSVIDWDQHVVGGMD